MDFGAFFAFERQTDPNSANIRGFLDQFAPDESLTDPIAAARASRKLSQIKLSNVSNSSSGSTGLLR